MNQRKIIVTSALPYANGEIHLGHVGSTYLPADIFTRFCKLEGADVTYVCATDDFGTPILIKAEKEGKTPKEYVSIWHKRDSDAFKGLGIDFDAFYQTSYAENVDLTQYFFTKLRNSGYIYSKKVRQFYCESDKKFLPDRYVLGTCPNCGAQRQYSDSCEICGRTIEPDGILNPICSICGSSPVKKESEHYFFRLSNLAKKLEDWLRSTENLQSQITNYVLNWIKEGLTDWDITRDITWGVPIPLKEAEGKVLYGWFDNHLCYISSALKYFNQKNIDGKDRWNSSEIYHFIGKDIVYHHYLFLTAMRFAADLEYKLPDSIPTRGHLLISGNKLSKSRGGYISLKDFLEAFPADYLRYYLASITPYSQSDVNFDLDDFVARINNELVANMGNFIHRTLSFVSTRFNQEVPPITTKDDADEEFLDKMGQLPVNVGSKIYKNELDRALKVIVEFSSNCNQYFQKKAPWANLDDSKTCLNLCVNAVRSLSITLYPYIPFSMSELWSNLGCADSIKEQSWNSAGDLLLSSGHRVREPRILFKKIEPSETKRWKDMLGVDNKIP